MEAFKVKIDQIEGPSWLETECFDISGKVPDGATREQVPAMLQALLTERFKLTAHTEDRARPGWVLVVDKDGPKFKEDDPKAKFLGSNAGKMFFGVGGNGALKGAMSMATLAANLSREGYGPVEDATGLTGKYDIEFNWARDPAAAPRDPTAAPAAETPAAEGLSLFDALRRSLGLRLDRRNVRVPFVVIDHIERTPTGN